MKAKDPKAAPDWRARLAPDWQVRDFVKRYRRVAVVGMPVDPNSDAVVRAERLLGYDFELFLVHSDCKSLLGRPCSPHLHSIAGEIDIVLVLPGAGISLLHVATEAIRKQVKVFWVEDGPIDEEVASLLMQAGIHVVAERSLEGEFAKL
jgi:predicted CoA-binding protein